MTKEFLVEVEFSECETRFQAHDEAICQDLAYTLSVFFRTYTEGQVPAVRVRPLNQVLTEEITVMALLRENLARQK